MKKLINKASVILKKVEASTITKAVSIALLIGGLVCIYLIKGNTLNTNNPTINGTNTNQNERYNVIETKEEEKEEENHVEESEQIEKVPENIIEKPTTPSTFETNTQTVPKSVIDPQPSPNNTAPSENNHTSTTKNADAEVVAYVNETESYFGNANLKEDIKARFIVIVDFLFYNGKIKGYTLNDLSAKTKLQVLKTALSIDAKIDKYIPGYKESITKTTDKVYTNVKNKIIESYLTITTKICTYDKSTCDSAKKDFQDMKKAFSITWNIIKNLVSNGTNHLKEWYEIFSGKTN